MKRYSITVLGRVQGVMFRDSARRKAKRLGIRGFVRNESDGTVYIEAEGEEEVLQKFLDWCRNGPPLSKVEKMNVHPGELKHFEDFIIEYRGFLDRF